VFIPGIFWGGGIPPLRKTYNPPKRLPNCAINLFSAGTVNYKIIYHVNFDLVDNEHRKLFVIKQQSKGCKFVPKCTEIRRDPLVELMRFPRPCCRNGDLLLRWTEGSEGKRERTERVKGKGSPYSIAERIGSRSWSRFLAVSLQVTWVIHPAVGCHYFPPGPQLPPQPLRGLLPILLLGEQRHDECEQFAWDCYPTASRLQFEPRPFCAWVQHANHSAIPSHPC